MGQENNDIILLLFSPKTRAGTIADPGDPGKVRERLGSQDLGEVGSHCATVGTVELDHVILNAALADHAPKLHSSLRGKGDEVVGKVADLIVSQFALAGFFSFDLLDQSAVLVEGEGGESIGALTLEKLIDRHNPLVVLGEVVEGDGSFEADEALSQVEHRRTSFESVSLGEHIVEPLPATTARVALVGLDVSGVLKVTTVLIDEVPDETVNVVLAPSEPVLGGRLDIPDTPPIKLSRVHLIDLIVFAMLTAVNSGEDQGVRVKVVTVQLAAVSQLEDALTDFEGSTINLVEEEDSRLFASHLEPIRRIEGGAIAFDAGQTNEVTLGHLAGTALDYRKTQATSDLIDHLALADAVATTEQDGQASSAHCGCKGYESFEVNSHVFLSPYILYYHGSVVGQVFNALFLKIFYLFFPPWEATVLPPAATQPRTLRLCIL